jgi:hypothetical protein
MMKKMTLIFAAIFGFIFCAECQSPDTLSAKVLWIKNLNKIYLIGIMPDVKSSDTIVVVSEVKKRKRKKREELKVGGKYTWAIQQAYWIASGPTKWSVRYGDVVWTNKEPLKKQPRLCLNCNGKYISPL